MLTLTVDSASNSTAAAAGGPLINWEFGRNMAYVTSVNLTDNDDGAYSVWYQPMSIVTASILPDRSLGTLQNATVIWGVNPAGINATMGLWVTSGSQAPASAVSSPGSFIGSVASISGNFTTNVTPTFPLASLIRDISDMSATPQQLIFLILAIFGMVAVSLCWTRFLKKSSQEGKGIGRAVIYIAAGSIFVAVSLYDFWMLVFVILFTLGIAAAQTIKRRGAA